MNYSVSVSGYQDSASEDEAQKFDAEIEAAVLAFVSSLPGVTAASVSTDRVRVTDVKARADERA